MHKNICRRLTCLIISVLMIMTLLPTGVFATDASSYSYFYVNGVDILTATNNTVECGSGTATLDLETNTLTLTNATITTFVGRTASYASGIYVHAASTSAIPEGLTIQLVGNNYITGSGSTSSSADKYCLYSQNVSTYIKGVEGGTLTISNAYNGLYLGTTSVSYSISDCTITASDFGNNPVSVSGTTTISNSTITVNNSSNTRGINAGGALTVSKSVITLNTGSAKNYGGLYSTNTSAGIVVEDSTIDSTNTGGGYAFYARLVTVSGDSNIIATGGFSTSSTGKINLTPTSGDEMSIIVGSSASSTTEYGIYDEDTTITTGYTELMYTTYPYFAITTSVGTGGTYKVAIADCTNGSVTASATTRIVPGDTVTLTVAADTDYQLSSLVVADASGNEVTLTDNGDGTYSFTMPSSNVTVTATFGYADGILYIFKGADTFEFKFSDYLDDYSAGDKITITATISGNGSSFNGVLGASDDVSGYWSSTYYETGDTTITLTVTVPDDYPDGGGELQCYGVYYGDGFYLTSFSIAKAGSGKLSGVKATIYINEEYHGLLVTRNNRRFLISVPHDVDENGYCTVCKEYIGGEETVETVTIDDVEYAVEFSAELNASSGNWNKVTLGDAGFAEALNTEEAILVIERDTEMSLSYADGDYEKFIVGKDDSSWIALSTSGTTTDDEDGLIAYVSDDGATVIYDGATVYAALSDAGLADLSSYVLISNTSGSYKIVSVKVLIPVTAE